MVGVEVMVAVRVVVVGLRGSKDGRNSSGDGGSSDGAFHLSSVIENQ